MDLTLGPEQEAIRDTIRGVLTDSQPSARVREVMSAEPPVDAGLWQEAAGLGWFGLALPEEQGGAGYGVVEAALLFQEIGRGVVPGPWLGTVLAARALAAAPGGRGPLAQLLAGSVRVGVIDDPADRLGRDAHVEGEARAVLDVGVADAWLVLGSERARYVAPSPTAVRVRGGCSIDPTRRIGSVVFAAAEAAARGGDARPPRGEAGPRHRRLEAATLVAAEALGVAERTLELSVEYAKVRRQFGKPIGAFQAIKHRCADMAVRAEVARAMVTYAAVALDEAEEGAARHVAMAKALAGGAAVTNATDNIQNHGGMGYTWESDAHLYLKRARLLEHCFGTRTAHLDALAAPWRGAP
jgi:alkylation response protein AidB-like acyl-CoA dehydrogenase